MNIPQSKHQQLITNPQILQRLSNLQTDLPSKYQSQYQQTFASTRSPHGETIKPSPGDDANVDPQQSQQPQQVQSNPQQQQQQLDTKNPSEFDFMGSYNVDDLKAYITTLIQDKAELQDKLQQQTAKADKLAQDYFLLNEKCDLVQKNFDTIESDYKLIQKRCFLLKDVISDILDQEVLSPSPIYATSPTPQPSQPPPAQSDQQK